MKKVGYIYNWEQLRDLNKPGSLYFSYFVNTGYQLDGDGVMAEQGAHYVAQAAFDFTFVYFSTIDLAGHIYGWMEPGYLEQAALVDKLAGQVIDAATPETTVIIHADHGGHERNHGDDIPEDMRIPWLIVGPGVRAGHTISAPVSLLDTAPTVCKVLGVPAPPEWEGRAVDEAFV
jgi:phosphopentomutase